MELFSSEYFMEQALKQAQLAEEQGEVPVGCVMVIQNKIIGKGHNLTETLTDVTAHAEMQAITAASITLGGKYLHDRTLYVTLEPCVMCAGALFWSQLSKIVFGAADPKRGFISANVSLHPKTEIIGGVLEKECQQILQNFFKQKRL